MSDKEKSTLYCRAWLSNDGRTLVWERVSKWRYLRERIVWGGIQRGDRTISVYIAAQNMDEPLTKRELQEIAAHELNGTYRVTEVNLR